MIDVEDARELLAEAERRQSLARTSLVERLAVLGTVDPGRLDGDDAPDVVALLCQRLPGGGAMLEDRWRVEALARLMERGGRAELTRVRLAARPHRDDALQRMLDAFTTGGGAALEERDEDELLASLDVWRWATEAVAHARQVGHVPIEPGKDAIESRLAMLDVTRAVRRLAGAGCVGRARELNRLHEYRLADLGRAGLASEPAMVVYGVGGVGKSTLVARFVMDLYEEQARDGSAVWAYLDLDRPTLASCDPQTLLADVIQQVAAQRVEQRRGFARAADVKHRRMKGAGLEAAHTAQSYLDEAVTFSRQLRSTGADALIVVLDTYEQLERNRPEQAADLHRLFAVLSTELPRFRLVVSGRAPASAFTDDRRPDRLLHVRPFVGPDAVEVLRFAVTTAAQQAGRAVPDVREELGREVVELVGGIPLTLRLAARVLVDEGPDAVLDATTRPHALDRVRSELVRGFLYQRILDHITVSPSPGGAAPRVDAAELRLVARAGIVLRELTAELVERVLAPSVDPRPTGTASDLFDQLATEVAFAQAHGGVLRLREELRLPALAALRLDDPELVRRVHERAVAFYAGSPDEDARLELAYHRLALGAPPSEFDPETLRRLEPAVDDLPPAAAERLRRGGLTAALPSDDDLEAWERTVLPAAEAALQGGRLAEARRLLAERTERSATSALHRLESSLAKAEGHLGAATSAAEKDVGAAAAAGDPERLAASALRLAALQEVAGAGPLAAETLRRAEESALLAGLPGIRLELLLNRMNTLERAGAGSESSRWLLGLQARALLQRCHRRETTLNTAVARLLAAALGRDEPERIRQAVRLVGVGHDEDPVRVQALIDALAAWDASMPQPGSLARSASLRPQDGEPAEIRRAWQAMAGLGTDAGYVIDRLWRQHPPPAEVRERLREVYLWWAVEERQPHERRHPGEEHFLTHVPIDWSDPAVQRLEELILTAYPTSTDSHSLVARAGLEPELFSWTSSTRRVTREMLGLASRTGRLEQLIGAVLADPEAVSVHAPLRDLVGEEWLAAHASGSAAAG